MDLVFCLLFFWCLCSTSQASHLNELSLIGKKAIQSKSVYFDTKEAKLAIDGDVNTFSYAETIEDSKVGWWEVDLGGNYNISEVSVTPQPSQSGDDVNDKQPFKILLFDTRRTSVNCNEDDTDITQQEANSFKCKISFSKFPIRYINIAKKKGSKDTDKIAIAECRVKTTFPATEKLELKEKKVSQSETWGKKSPELAIDGDKDTYSVSASEKNPSARGWWEIELGKSYQIGVVIITASSDVDNAKYLQIFSIWLFDEDETTHLCYKYTSEIPLRPGETRNFPCKNYQLLANRVRIARDGGHRQDAIALAEVKITAGVPPAMTEIDKKECIARCEENF